MGGGLEDPPCIKIGYSSRLVPTAEKGHPAMCLDRVCLGNVLRYGIGYYCFNVAYNFINVIRWFRQCIKMMFLVMYKDTESSRKVLGSGVGYFQNCEIFFRIFGPPAPVREKYSAAA